MINYKNSGSLALAGLLFSLTISTSVHAEDPYFNQQQKYWQNQEFPNHAGAQSIAAAENELNSTNIVRIGVVDGGFVTTPDLTYADGYNFVSTDGRSSNYIEPEANLNETCTKGHGTAVSSVIAAKWDNWGIKGIIPNAEIIAARATKCDTFTLQDEADAITWLSGGQVEGVETISEPVNIINISLGTYGTCMEPLKSAVANAISKGITIVAAAGNNEPEDGEEAPSSCPGVVGVGSVNSEGLKSIFSVLNTFNDISAVGENVVLPTALDLDSDGELEFGTWNGTSFSTPIVTGIASMILSEYPSLKPYELDAILKASAGKIVSPNEYTGTLDTSGRDCLESNKCGFGVVNAKKALDIARQYENSETFSIVSRLNGMNDCDVKFLLDSIGKTVDVCSVYSFNLNKNVAKSSITTEVYELPSTSDLLASNGALVGKSTSGTIKLTDVKDDSSVQFGYRFCTTDGLFGTYECESEQLVPIKKVDLTKSALCDEQ